ncbi:hypothetical protein [Paracoccus pantotrophus]|uniref:hypothetical protein n=1 Tax=Paracoccus pantotrophus TaxID=82367 RepID=UPI0012DF2CC2|nr:hypothetical protein [Paracoccus pantotrophus]
MSENEGVKAISGDDPAGELLCWIVASIPDSVQSFEFDRDAKNGYFARLRLTQPQRATSGKRGVA